MRTTTLASAVCICAAMTGLTACTSSGDSGSSDAKAGAASKTSAEPSKAAVAYADLRGSELQEKVLAATRGATSMRVAGHVVEAGSKTEIDVALNTRGECAGSVSVQGKGTGEIIKTSELLFYKADAAFWRSQAPKRLAKKQVDSMVALVADRWIRVKTSDPRAGKMASVCDLDKLMRSFKVNPLARKGEPTTVNGQTTLPVTTPAKGGLETWYVATQGKPYLLKATKDGDKPTEISMSAFNQPVSLTPPADKDIVDLSKLRGPTTAV